MKKDEFIIIDKDNNSIINNFNNLGIIVWYYPKSKVQITLSMWGDAITVSNYFKETVNSKYVTLETNALQYFEYSNLSSNEIDDFNKFLDCPDYIPEFIKRNIKE